MSRCEQGRTYGPKGLRPALARSSLTSSGGHDPSAHCRSRILAHVLDTSLS